jgi:hypothetical protein
MPYFSQISCAVRSRSNLIACSLLPSRREIQMPMIVTWTRLPKKPSKNRKESENMDTIQWHLPAAFCCA